jgi:hypothetical protein
VNDSGVPGTASPMAEHLADRPDVWRRLLADHVADRLGRCAACRRAGGSGEVWPCSLHHIARDAQRIYGLRLGRSGGE